MTHTSAQTAHSIVTALRHHDVPPGAEFTSASGLNHGHVEAWAIDDDKHVVAYGNNGQTDYEIADGEIEDADLAVWLLTDGYGDNDLGRAAVGGPDCISQPTSGEVKVIRHKHMQDSCGNGDEYTCIAPEECAQDWDSATVYASPEEALAAIEIICPVDDLYWLEHNEMERPSFYIVAA